MWCGQYLSGSSSSPLRAKRRRHNQMSSPRMTAQAATEARKISNAAFGQASCSTSSCRMYLAAELRRDIIPISICHRAMA